jgi:hypothetical protein
MFELLITLFVFSATGLIFLAGAVFLAIITLADPSVGAPLLSGWLLLWFLLLRYLRKPITLHAPLGGFVGGDGI